MHEPEVSMGARCRQVFIIFLAAVAPIVFLVVSRSPVLSGQVILSYQISTVTMFLLVIRACRRANPCARRSFALFTKAVMALAVYAGLLAAAGYVVAPDESFFRVFGGVGTYLANVAMFTWAVAVAYASSEPNCGEESTRNSTSQR